MTDIIIPEDMWSGDQEGVLVCWTFENGATVRQGEVAAEVALEKAQMEICAPASGVLRQMAREEDVLKGGAVIGAID